MDCAVKAEASGSTGLVKANSLQQFNYAQILGIPSAAGMIPVIYPVQLHSKCAGGVRGIIHYGGTMNGRCDWYKEDKDVCRTGFGAGYRYNWLETITDEAKKETRFCRHRGTASIDFVDTKEIWRGQAIWKAPYRLESCDNKNCCFNYKDNEEPVEEEIKLPATRKKKTKTTSCGCGRKK
jgi:hypothetical protein